VRVGLAAAKGLSEALGKPVVAVSNLQALAWHGQAALRAAVMDARREQVYGRSTRRSLSWWAPMVVAAFADWIATLPEGGFEFVCQDGVWMRALLAGTRFEQAAVVAAPRGLAGAIARIAAARIASGEAQDPAEADANYVRRSDAELFWRTR